MGSSPILGTNIRQAGFLLVFLILSSILWDLKRANTSHGAKRVRFERRGRVAQYFQACAENIDAKVTKSLSRHQHKTSQLLAGFSFFLSVIHETWKKTLL